MDDTRGMLIFRAREVGGERALPHGLSIGSVGAALLTSAGDIYTGICLDLACGLGFCAEVAAIAEMLKSRQTRIIAIVAVSKDRVIPPCGRCRETILQIDQENGDCRVILGADREAPLRDLMPEHWLR